MNRSLLTAARFLLHLTLQLFFFFSYRERSHCFKSIPGHGTIPGFICPDHTYETWMIEGSCCCSCRWWWLQITQTNAFLSLGREVKVLVYEQLEKKKEKKQKKIYTLQQTVSLGLGGVRKLISPKQAVRDEAKQMARLRNGKTGSRCGHRFSPCITGNQPVGEELCITRIIWYQNCP